MNILFLSLLDFNSLKEKNIYTDLLRCFCENGHHVCAISPVEKRLDKNTELIKESNCDILKLKIGNIQKTNIFEKGISTLRIESKFIDGIKKYFPNRKFDLVLYSTPPITFQKVVNFVKKRDQSKSYLLLKDIFPQNAVDLEMITKRGAIYRFFRNKEKKLYKSADFIGCMSKGNKDYLIKNNPWLEPSKVEINPNSKTISSLRVNDNKTSIRTKFGIPEDKVVFLYGGNLGKPQGLDFLIEYLKVHDIEDAFFLIIGSGTEYKKLESFFSEVKPKNAVLLTQLPKNEYTELEQTADVGLVFLDSRFTIPNIPSRILGYMDAAIPILAATDVNTDLKDLIQEGQFGLWVKHGDIEAFKSEVTKFLDSQFRKTKGENARVFLESEFDVKKSYQLIIEKMGK